MMTTVCRAQSPQDLVEGAVNYWRDNSSKAEADMVIHRPDWERKLSIITLTEGNERSLVRFTAPAKDAGSATLSIGDETWSFAPKINRVIKIPASMKAQSWMGSDFSYRDLTKSDDIIDQYIHKLVSEKENDGHRIFIIESTPKEFAPVVWGKEVLEIRDDKIILKHEFYDQSGKLIKVLEAKKITEMDGKLYPKVMRITKVEEKDEWTEIVHNSIKFNIEISDTEFTLSSLSNPR